MPALSRSPIAFALLGLSMAVALGCGDTLEADGEMNRQLDRVSEATTGLEAEIASHATGLATARDVTAIEGAEAAHRNAMNGYMADLEPKLADMMTFCRQRQSQERGRTHEMLSALASLRTELERHRTASRADVVAVALDEEQQHLRETRAALLRIRDATSAMRHEAGFYRCEHSNH